MAGASAHQVIGAPHRSNGYGVPAVYRHGRAGRARTASPARPGSPAAGGYRRRLARSFAVVP